MSVITIAEGGRNYRSALCKFFLELDDWVKCRFAYNRRKGGVGRAVDELLYGGNGRR